MKLLHKNELDYPQLMDGDAARLLETVFQEASIEPNTIPLEVLMSYSNYRRQRFSFQRVTLIIMMALFCLLPFLFIAPEVHMEETRTVEQYLPIYEITVDTVFPSVAWISADIGGMNLPVYETGDNVFSIQPTLNGEMDVTVALTNHQYKTLSVTVSDVDLKAPTLLGSTLQNGILLLHLDDDVSGIDYEGIYATDDTGKTCYPVSFDKENQTVAFENPGDSLNIFVPDNSKNMLQLVLTVK